MERAQPRECVSNSPSNVNHNNSSTIFESVDTLQGTPIPDEVVELEKRLEDRNKEIKNLRLQLNQVEDENIDLKHELDLRNGKIKELLKKLSEKRSMITQLQADLLENTPSETTCVDEVAKNRNEKQKLKNELKRLEEYSATLAQQVEKIQKEKDDINCKKEILERDSKMWCAEVQFLKISLEEAVHDLKVTQDECSTLLRANEEQQKHINLMRNKVNVSIESDNQSNHTLFMSLSESIDSTPLSQTVVDVKLKETEQKVKQMEDEHALLKRDYQEALVDLEKEKREKERLLELLEEMRKDMKKALVLSTHSESLPTLNVENSDQDQSENNICNRTESETDEFKKWLENINKNARENNLAIQNATRARLTLSEKLEEQYATNKLLEEHKKTLIRELATSNALLSTKEKEKQDLVKEVKCRYTAAQIGEFEKQCNGKLEKMKETFTKEIEKMNALKKNHDRVETLCQEYLDQIKKYELQILQLESNIRDLRQQLRLKTMENDSLRKKLATVEMRQDKSLVSHDDVTRRLGHVNKPLRSRDPEPSTSHGRKLKDEGEAGVGRQQPFFHDPSTKKSTRLLSNTEDPARIAELQYRNSRCLPHLKSTYAAETNFNAAKKFTEKDLKFGYTSMAPDGPSQHTMPDSEQTVEHKKTRLDVPHTTVSSPRRALHDRNQQIGAAKSRTPIQSLFNRPRLNRDAVKSPVTPLRARFNIPE